MFFLVKQVLWGLDIDFQEVKQKINPIYHQSKVSLELVKKCNS